MVNDTDKLQILRERIYKYANKHHQNHDKITLIGASKTRLAKDIRNFYAAGLHDFGENYLEEALTKQKELTDLPITWHFIGSIQSNKTKAIAENFDWVHTVTREKIARRLNQQRTNTKQPLNVLIQINIDNEPSKSGVSVNDVEALANAILDHPNLALRGLMSIPKPRQNYADQLAIHKKLIDIKNSIEHNLNISMDTLSAGMSDDTEAAIEAGSTMIRIGTDLFGKRK